MNTIIIAFDGLDYELIKEFELENINQKEFAKIDNKTGMTEISTSELFASFITGETHEEHGIKGLRKWTNPRIDNFERKVEENTFFNKFKGLRSAIFESINKLGAMQRKYRKEDLGCRTIFEEIENSRAMYVPSYNPSPYWMIGAGLKPLRYGYSPKEVEELWDDKEYRDRKAKLFSELESDVLPPRELLMCHIHRPDIHQHLYGDRFLSKEDSTFDKAKLKQLYQETDKLAGKIKKKALEKGYNRIIFMSDHGLPTATEHNENAFYSSNIELFDSREPHIKDFYEILKEGKFK